MMIIIKIVLHFIFFYIYIFIKLTIMPHRKSISINGHSKSCRCPGCKQSRNNINRGTQAIHINTTLHQQIELLNQKLDDKEHKINILEVNIRDLESNNDILKIENESILKDLKNYKELYEKNIILINSLKEQIEQTNIENNKLLELNNNKSIIIENYRSSLEEYINKT